MLSNVSEVNIEVGGKGGEGENWKKWWDISNIQFFLQNNVDVEVLPTYFVVGCLRNTFSRNSWFVVFFCILDPQSDSVRDNRIIDDHFPISDVRMHSLFDVTATTTCESGK